MSPDDCYYKTGHLTEKFYINSKCPHCDWVHPENRKNIEPIGEMWIISFNWVTYRRTIEKDFHDPYSKGEGEWGDHVGYALLNKDFQVVLNLADKESIIEKYNLIHGP